MCGICGIVNFTEGVAGAEPVLRGMNDSLRHRGPDDEGFFADPHAALAMRRLSIIDLEGGKQPIFNEDRTALIVFNGEIYNYRELRDSLEKSGHVFRTRSDTETILHLYEDHGSACLERLRGMFAFAVYDIPRRTLFLARDRAGVKPLVYTRVGDTLLFASEIKALLKHPALKPEIHLPSLAKYLMHLYIPGDESIFKGVLRLPPGHCLTHSPKGTTISRWWAPPRTAPADKTPAQWREEIVAGLRESVREHLVSDVPVGCFLSGGIDSSAVAAFMRDATDADFSAWSIGFPEKTFNELPFAAAVAKKLNADHHEITVQFPKLDEFTAAIAREFDEPFADPSALPTWIICREASRQMKVMLSGNGGDELFGGYSKFTAEYVNRLVSIVPAPIRAAALAALGALLGESTRAGDKTRRIKRILRYSLTPAALRPVSWINGFDHSGLARILNPDVLREMEKDDPLTPLRRHFEANPDADTVARQLFTEFMTFLPDNNLYKDDSLGMVHSLEIRVPFLDHRLIETAFAIPSTLKVRGTSTKHILREALSGILPAEILNRPKQGFIAPVGKWLKADLFGFTKQMLFENQNKMGGYFGKPNIKRVFDEHSQGKVDHSHRLWLLLILFLWGDR